MTTPHEAQDAPESLSDLFAVPPPADDDNGEALRFAEINERRARVENAELLAHLRGL